MKFTAVCYTREWFCMELSLRAKSVLILYNGDGLPERGMYAKEDVLAVYSLNYRIWIGGRASRYQYPQVNTGVIQCGSLQ